MDSESYSNRRLSWNISFLLHWESLNTMKSGSASSLVVSFCLISNIVSICLLHFLSSWILWKFPSSHVRILVSNVVTFPAGIWGYSCIQDTCICSITCENQLYVSVLHSFLLRLVDSNRYMWPCRDMHRVVNFHPPGFLFACGLPPLIFEAYILVPCTSDFVSYKNLNKIVKYYSLRPSG